MSTSVLQTSDIQSPTPQDISTDSPTPNTTPNSTPNTTTDEAVNSNDTIEPPTVNPSIKEAKDTWVRKPNPSTKANPNEIRIRSDGEVPQYAGYGQKVIRSNGSVVVRATGRPIQTAVTTAEALKSRIAGLHQVTKTGTVPLEDTFNNEHGESRSVKKNVALIEITLTLNPTPEELSDPGYQPPLTDEERRAIRSIHTARRNNKSKSPKAKNTKAATPSIPKEDAEKVEGDVIEA